MCSSAKQHSGVQFSPKFTKQRTSGQSVTSGDTVTDMGADRNGPSPCPGSAPARSMAFPSTKSKATIMQGYSMLHCPLLSFLLSSIVCITKIWFVCHTSLRFITTLEMQYRIDLLIRQNWGEKAVLKRFMYFWEQVVQNDPSINRSTGMSSQEMSPLLFGPKSIICVCICICWCMYRQTYIPLNGGSISPLLRKARFR